MESNIDKFSARIDKQWIRSLLIPAHDLLYLLTCIGSFVYVTYLPFDIGGAKDATLPYELWTQCSSLLFKANFTACIVLMFATCQAMTLLKISADQESTTRELVGYRVSWMVYNAWILAFLLSCYLIMIGVTEVNLCRAALHTCPTKNQSVIILRKVLS